MGCGPVGRVAELGSLIWPHHTPCPHSTQPKSYFSPERPVCSCIQTVATSPSTPMVLALPAFGSSARRERLTALWLFARSCAAVSVSLSCSRHDATALSDQKMVVTRSDCSMSSLLARLTALGRSSLMQDRIQSDIFRDLWPNHALQRLTRRGRRGCSRCVPCAGSLSLGR